MLVVVVHCCVLMCVVVCSYAVAVCWVWLCVDVCGYCVVVGLSCVVV